MSDFEFVVLYVTDVAKSAAFYSAIVGKEPRALSPTFLSYQLPTGMILELWQKDKVQPPGTATGGGTEIGFRAPDAAAVRKLHDQWKARGVAMAQPPTRMVFGLTFVALDPDGHRVRVVEAAPSSG